MKTIVTGASGLIGRFLVQRLEADGIEVVRLVRRPPADAGEIEWDPVAGTIDSAGLEGADAVFHLAGAGIGDSRM